MAGVTIPFLPSALWLLAILSLIALGLLSLSFVVYYRKRIHAALGVEADVAELEAKRTILDSDVNNLRQWMIDSKIELDRLRAEREQQEVIRAELQRLEQQCATKEQENEELRQEVGELENQRHMLGQRLEHLSREIGDLEGKREESQSLNRQLEELRKHAEEAREVVRRVAEHEVRLNALATEKAVLEQQVEEFKAATEKGHAAAEEARETVAALADMRRERAQLDILLDALRHEQNALEQDISRLEKQDSETEEELKLLLNQVRDARQEAEAAITNRAQAKIELVNTQKELQQRRGEAEELQTRKAVLLRELEKLEGRIGGGAGADNPFTPYADLLEIEPGAFPGTSRRIECREKQDETTALQRFMNALTDNGLSFSSRVVNAFHTSLKCHDINPLTVLAGVSGTGKTLLPVCYARMMGMHSLILSVQPRWDSPQDMFGFYNYLERQYKATELSRALVRMDPYNYPRDTFQMFDGQWTRDRMLLVLLDEMNLARTEYYFSDFLSKLELRRLVKDPSKPEDRKDAEIELDAGPGKDSRFRLWVDRNVLFVGTMNEDETTQTLSDKVLDRANVLRFGMPADATRHNGDGTLEIPLSERFLSRKQWLAWHRPLDPTAAWSDEIQKTITALNGAMNHVGRPFGYRVRNAFLQYVANYPRVNEESRHKLAVADQVEQKILPKLRGIDCNEDGAGRCLEDLARIIDGLGDAELAETFKIAQVESRNFGMFQWRGVTRTSDHVG